MDFDDFKELLTTFAVILVTAFFGYFAEAVKKKKQRLQSHAQTERSRIESEPYQSIQTPPAPVDEKNTPAISSSFIEGERVTKDTPTETVKTENNICELGREGLRRAVIWSEILSPKFDK